MSFEHLGAALHNRLSTHLDVIAALGDPPRLYDSPPEDPIFPYLTYGRQRADNIGGDGVALQRHGQTLHVWSRYAGRAEVFDILRAVTTALQSAPLVLGSGDMAASHIAYTDVLRAPDGLTYHGVLRLSFIIQSEGASA